MEKLFAKINVWKKTFQASFRSLFVSLRFSAYFSIFPLITRKVFSLASKEQAFLLKYNPVRSI